MLFEKSIFHLIFHELNRLIDFTTGDLGDICIVILYFPVDHIINFKINLDFFYQVIFLYD